MKVQNMTNSNGNKVANQFIITDIQPENDSCIEIFKSYDSVIAKIEGWDSDENRKVYLDSKYWNYSRTTAKYRNQFLGETTKETQAKIDSGEYILINLN